MNAIGRFFRWAWSGVAGTMRRWFESEGNQRAVVASERVGSKAINVVRKVVSWIRFDPRSSTWGWLKRSWNFAMDVVETAVCSTIRTLTSRTVSQFLIPYFWSGGGWGYAAAACMIILTT